MKTTAKIPYYDAQLIRKGEHVEIRHSHGSAYHVIAGPFRGEGNVMFLRDLYVVVRDQMTSNHAIKSYLTDIINSL